MALSRGETCGLTLHKKKKEIEQKYSQGTVSSWGLYFMCFERKKLETWNTFPGRVWDVIPEWQDALQHQMRCPRQARDCYFCLCGISYWLIHQAPCWGRELLWKALWVSCLGIHHWVWFPFLLPVLECRCSGFWYWVPLWTESLVPCPVKQKVV